MEFDMGFQRLVYEDGFTYTSDPGGGSLMRKRFPDLKLRARVFQEATNLLEPLPPPEQPTKPSGTVVVNKPQFGFIRKYTRRHTKMGIAKRRHRKTFPFTANLLEAFGK